MSSQMSIGGTSLINSNLTMQQIALGYMVQVIPVEGPYLKTIDWFVSYGLPILRRLFRL